jgi:hypothetical protein
MAAEPHSVAGAHRSSTRSFPYKNLLSIHSLFRGARAARAYHMGAHVQGFFAPVLIAVLAAALVRLAEWLALSWLNRALRRTSTA